MSDRTLRYIIALAIAMLLIFQIGTLISGFFGMVWGLVSAIVDYCRKNTPGKLA